MNINKLKKKKKRNILVKAGILLKMLSAIAMFGDWQRNISTAPSSSQEIAHTASGHGGPGAGVARRRVWESLVFPCDILLILLVTRDHHRLLGKLQVDHVFLSVPWPGAGHLG